MSAGPSSLRLSSSEQKELDAVWQEVQAKVVELAGGNPRKIQNLGIGDVIQQLDSHNNKKEPESYARFKQIVNRTLQCIETVGNIVSQGVSTVIAPASTCYSALTFVIQAWKGYEGIFENLSELLEKCVEFLDRLGYYDRKMDAALTRLACQNLRLFVEICDRTVRLRKKHTRFLAFTKKLFLNDDGVQGLLGLMDKLNNKESLLVAAQTFQIVNDSAGDLKIVVEGQMEQKTKQDSKQRRQQIIEALNFRENELTSTGQPTAAWRRTLDSYMNNIVANTGDWLFSDPTFLDWAQAPVPSKPIILLQGTNYTGKTSMMTSVLRFLRKQEDNVPTPRIVAAYFLADEEMKQFDKSGSKTDLEMVSKSLLWQVAVSFEALTKSVAHRVQTSNGFTGWMDLWEQLYIDNPERLNPDTTFFFFIDGTSADEADLNALVPLLQKLIATTKDGKTRIFLTGEPMAIANYIGQFNEVPLEVIDLPRRNKSDIENYITYRMDSMPILRDPSRPGISQWRERIILKLSGKCDGDYFKLNSSLNALAHMDLVEDIEEVLTRADEARSDQIQAEIALLNESRTLKEIQEVNEIIIWVEMGRSWFTVDTMEALLSIKHQAGAATEDPSASLRRSATGTLTAPLPSSNGTLTVSLLSFSQRLLKKYCIFTLSEKSEVRWRDPETKSHIPNKSALQPIGSSSGNSSRGLQQIGEGEIAIVRHFLHNVCPPNLYNIFDFETFFESKLRAQAKQHIYFDEENAHIRIVIAYLTILTSEILQGTKDLLLHARRDLLFHLSKVDLSAADPSLKRQVGPLLVRMLTEECGATALFLPTNLFSYTVRTTIEVPDLRSVRAEWLYSLEGTREVFRWLSDATVTKLISGNVAQSYVQDVNTLGRNLHQVVFSHAAKHIASRLFYDTRLRVHWLVSPALFLRGYLMRCDPDIASQMATNSAFYKAREGELAKEIERMFNFDASILEKIEEWASNALDKQGNGPSQDSLWEYQAFSFLNNLCSSANNDESTTRVKKALELDSTNFRARLKLVLLESTSDQEAIDTLSVLKRDLEANPNMAKSEVLAVALLELGNRVWDAAEDRQLATSYYAESIRTAYVGWDYESFLTRYIDASDFEGLWVTLKVFSESHEIWRHHADQLYPILNLALLQHHEMIAKVVERAQDWDTFSMLFNAIADKLRDFGSFGHLIECKKFVASCFAHSSDAAIRGQQVTCYEEALTIFKNNPTALSNNPASFGNPTAMFNSSSFDMFLIVGEVVGVYFERALASEPGSEQFDFYLSKLTSLLSMADETGDISAAVSPVCSLIIIYRKTGQSSDTVTKWTHRIMLEVIELLSDDDDSNDLEAYSFVLQLLIALQDFENIRIATMMMKWEFHLSIARTLDEQVQSQLSDNKHLMHGSSGENISAESEVCTHSEEFCSSEPKTTPANRGISSDSSGNNPEEGTPEASEAASNHEDEGDTEPEVKSWAICCGTCQDGIATEDRGTYMCTQCVSIIMFDADCYEKLMAGTLEKQTECSNEHPFIYIPPWKPGAELPKGQVPQLEIGAEGEDLVEMVGFISLDEWKANLKSLHLNN